MSITDTELKIFASQRIDGGGNQSPRKLAKALGCELVDLAGDWNVEARRQIWYMNDDIYRLNKGERKKFEKVLSTAEDIIVVLNFVIGDTHRQDWPIRFPVSKIIFLNKGRLAEWNKATKGTPHNFIPTEAILPPIDEIPLTRVDSEKVRIGRHSRISLKYPPDPCPLYKALDRKDREFSFMIAHHRIQENFPHFKCYSWNEIPVSEFLNNIDIYLAIIHPKTREQGGRSNMEAMMAGCCVIVENRDGPKDYITHGKTGFLVESEQEAIDIVNSLTKQEIKRIGTNARKYALKNFKIDNWIKLWPIIGHTNKSSIP